MKKIIILLILLLSINTVFSQSEGIDIMLQKISAEKDDNTRIDLINNLISKTVASDPLLDMKINQKLLLQSQKNKDKITEAMTLSNIGYDYMSFGNTPKSVEYNLKANSLAQEIGNEKLIANTKINIAHNYVRPGNYRKAIRLYFSAEELASNVKDFVLQSWAYEGLGRVYIEMNKIDSALMYSQRDYELNMRTLRGRFLKQVRRNN